MRADVWLVLDESCAMAEDMPELKFIDHKHVVA